MVLSWENIENVWKLMSTLPIAVCAGLVNATEPARRLHGACTAPARREGGSELPPRMPQRPLATAAATGGRSSSHAMDAALGRDGLIAFLELGLGW